MHTNTIKYHQIPTCHLESRWVESICESWRMLETWMHRLSPTPFTHAFTGRPLWLLEVVTYEPQDPRAKCGSQICQAEFLISYFSCAITLHTWAARVWQGAYQPPHTSCQSDHISPPFIENDRELESLFSRCSNRGWGGARDRFATIQGHASRPGSEDAERQQHFCTILDNLNRLVSLLEKRTRRAGCGFIFHLSNLPG